MKVFDTNQNIGIIDLGKSFSCKKYIKNVMAKQLIVIAEMTVCDVSS